MEGNGMEEIQPNREPGPEYQPQPFTAGSGYRDIEGLGRCIWLDIQTPSTRVVIFFPPGAAKQWAQQIISEDTGVAGLTIAKTLPPSPRVN